MRSQSRRAHCTRVGRRALTLFAFALAAWKQQSARQKSEADSEPRGSGAIYILVSLLCVLFLLLLPENSRQSFSAGHRAGPSGQNNLAASASCLSFSSSCLFFCSACFCFSSATFFAAFSVSALLA
eukprot:1799904-Rhodomonas_salina.3